MASLYEIKEEYRQVLENLEVNEDGEILNIDALEDAGERFDDKLEAVALFVKNEEAFVKSCKEEEKALKARIQSHENKAERLRDYISRCMGEVGYDKFERPAVKLSFRKSESVEVKDERFIPDEFVTSVTTSKIDRMALKKAMKDGLVVEGVEIVEKANLQIK